MIDIINWSDFIMTGGELKWFILNDNFDPSDGDALCLLVLAASADEAVNKAKEEYGELKAVLQLEGSIKILDGFESVTSGSGVYLLASGGW